MKLTETTMQEVLQDIKAKYEAAVKGKGNAMNQVLTLGDSKSVVEQAMKDMSDRILKSCESIQNLCKNFNLVDELNITLQQLETEAGLLTSFTAKKQAGDFIESIKTLIDNLSKHSSRKKIGRGSGAFQYRDDEKKKKKKRGKKRKQPEGDAKKSQKRVCIIQNGNYIPKTEKIWNTLVTKAQKAPFNCELIKVHVDDSVKATSLPSEEWDVVIWIETASDFKHISIINDLAHIRGDKKLVIQLYFSADTTGPRLKPQNLTSYQGGNIFSFMGGTHGLHPKSQWQQEQEALVLQYITGN